MSESKSKTAIAILGATGSIGTAGLDVIRELGEPWRAVGVSAHSRVGALARIATEFQPEMVGFTCTESLSNTPAAGAEIKGEVLQGPDALVRIAQSEQVDTVLAAVVGSAGLMSTLAAAEAGKRLALANKEALVVAGGLVTEAVRRSGGEMIPVDSEHSAIFQAMQAGAGKEVQYIVLTASGGPFRKWTQEQLKQATIEDALAHPTWQMGRKVTIDSATMMNKALEIIEAKWLFDLPRDKIKVMVHPQSIIHSMVEYVDGSVMAQMSPPDMKLPIQYALTYPERTQCPSPKFDWCSTIELELEPVDTDRFPAIELGWEVAERGGTCGAVLNAANEVAVEQFLEGKLRFTQIVEGCRRIMDAHHYEPNPSLEELMRQDQWARQEIMKWISQT